MLNMHCGENTKLGDVCQAKIAIIEKSLFFYINITTIVILPLVRMLRILREINKTDTRINENLF